MDLRQFPVSLVRVVDGDTQDVNVDLGFRVSLKARLRLIGVDTPEKYGSTKVAGLKATAFSANWWKDAKVTVRLAGFGKFGRPLVYVENAAGQSLNKALIESGNALYYCGGKKKQ